MPAVLPDTSASLPLSCMSMNDILDWVNGWILQSFKSGFTADRIALE
jgi:hypothetical protein